MPEIVSRVFRQSAWLLLCLLSCFLVISTTFYFSFRTDINFLLAKQDLIHNPVWMSFFYIHITGGILALGTGPFQWLQAVRSRVKLHRLLGRLYVFGILVLAGPSGLYMALYANGGWPAGLGFFILSCLWMAFTLLAVQQIRRGDIAGHKKWMARSFALTFSAVTLRLWVPVLSLWLDTDFNLTVILSAWINWIPNLAVAEWWIRSGQSMLVHAGKRTALQLVSNP